MAPKPFHILTLAAILLLTCPMAGAAGPQDAPLGLVAAATSPSSVSLTWSEPLTANGSSLTYNVYRGDGVSAPVLLGTAGDTSYLDDVALNATGAFFFVYEVRAVSEGVESPASNPAIVPAGTCLLIDSTTTPPTIYYSEDPLSDCIPPLP